MGKERLSEEAEAIHHSGIIQAATAAEVGARYLEPGGQDMKNEYGVKLDSNGYAPSIVQDDMESCYICGLGGDLIRHEPFNGSNREKSKNLGLWVNLCEFDHRMCHQYPSTYGGSLKRQAQAKAMRHYEWDYDDWRRRFGKSYL